MTTRRAVFIDRDGTISEEVGYMNDLERYRLLPNSPEAIRIAREAGYLVVVVTNQSGVARGYFPESLVHQVHDKLNGLIRDAGTEIDAIYYCPHHPEEGEPPFRQECACRKPHSGLIERAASDLHIDLSRSYIIGDSWVDIEAGARAGMPGILVLTGYGRGLIEHQRHLFTSAPTHVAEDLLDAVRWILSREGVAERREAAAPKEAR